MGCTAVCTVLATQWLGESAITVVTLVLIPIWLIFNQIIPEGLFLYYATPAATLFAGWFIRLRWSCIRSPSRSTSCRRADALLPADPSTRLLNVSTEELLFHIGDSRSAGLIAPETTALIDRAIELKQLSVRDVLTTLIQVIMLDDDAPVDCMRRSSRARNSRVIRCIVATAAT